MPEDDATTVRTLRLDVAAQLSRHFARMGSSQSAAAQRFKIPQPTISKIINGHVTDLSVELLLRVAVRTGLPITLMTGRTPEEAGAFLSILGPLEATPGSELANAARGSNRRAQDRLTPAQRAEAFLEHNEQINELQQSAKAARKRAHK